MKATSRSVRGRGGEVGVDEAISARNGDSA